MSFGTPEPSVWTVWPTKVNPGSLYRLASIWLEQGLAERNTERKTYSLLEWLGDVGGLFDGLYLASLILVQPFSTYALRTVLLATVLGQ